jgi:hypothetical protein
MRCKIVADKSTILMTHLRFILDYEFETVEPQGDIEDQIYLSFVDRDVADKFFKAWNKTGPFLTKNGNEFDFCWHSSLIRPLELRQNLDKILDS